MMNVKKNVTAYINFIFYLILVTAGLVFLFLSRAPSPDGVVAWAYYISSFSYYGLAILIICFFIYPLFWCRLTRWLVPVICWLWLVYLVSDLVVFKLYNFHIDLLIIEMLIFDFRGMGIPPFLLLFSVFSFLFILAFLLALQHFAGKVGDWHTIAASLGVFLVVPLFLVQSLISIWAHRFDRQEITQYSSFLPFFYPVQSYSEGAVIAARFPQLMPAIAGEAGSDRPTASGIINYPRSTIECSSDHPQSILMIVLESWQADMLSPDIMPELWSFSEKNYRFEKHISSGSTTIPGLFGLLFGLHPTYYDAFASEAVSNPSQFTGILDQKGYLKSVFTTGSLERFAQRTLFFSQVPDANYHEGKDDAEMVDRYLESLSDPRREEGPSFDFLLLTSSHSPYLYPEGFEKFKPVPSVAGGYIFDRMAEGETYKNRYRNSFYFLDSLLEKIVAGLDERGLLEDTWLVVTGDHGEAFNESGLGFWGHGSTFSRWQTQVPLVLSAPGREGRIESRLSLHQDVVPTLLKNAVGCDTDIRSYSNGHSLFDLPRERGAVVASYSFNAYWVNDVIYERHSGKKYAWDDVGERVNKVDTGAVRQLWEEERLFFYGGSVNE
jgi:membrane-anchored protein YejM (alkaline phosphatase superfamily)